MSTTVANGHAVAPRHLTNWSVCPLGNVDGCRVPVEHAHGASAFCGQIFSASFMKPWRIDILLIHYLVVPNFALDVSAMKARTLASQSTRLENV